MARDDCRSRPGAETGGSVNRHQQGRAHGLRRRRALHRDGRGRAFRVGSLERAWGSPLYHQDGFLLLTTERWRRAGSSTRASRCCAAAATRPSASGRVSPARLPVGPPANIATATSARAPAGSRAGRCSRGSPRRPPRTASVSSRGSRSIGSLKPTPGSPAFATTDSNGAARRRRARRRRRLDAGAAAAPGGVMWTVGQPVVHLTGSARQMAGAAVPCMGGRHLAHRLVRLPRPRGRDAEDRPPRPGPPRPPR